MVTGTKGMAVSQAKEERKMTTEADAAVTVQ